MIAILKKYWRIFLIFLIGIPWIMNMGIGVIPGNGSNDGWLGFWGGYLGSIVAVLFTVIFTICYSNKQLEINRKAQVQAYIEQSKIMALRNYELTLLKSYDVFSDAYKLLIGGDFEGFRAFREKMEKAIDELQKKSIDFQILTNDKEAKLIVDMQNKLLNDYKKINSLALMEISLGMENKITKSKDGRRTSSQELPTSSEHLKKEANKISSFAKELLNCANEVKSVFEKTYS